MLDPLGLSPLLSGTTPILGSFPPIAFQSHPIRPMSQSQAMLFVVVRTRHEIDPDRGPLWEARCIPGNLVGVGRTPQEAEEKLVGLLEWTEEEEPSFQEWYRGSWSYADQEDQEMYNRFVITHHRSLQNSKPINDRFSFGMATCPA
jgi:hypothetical protein